MCRTGAGLWAGPTAPGIRACACSVSRLWATGPACSAPCKPSLLRVGVNLDHLIEEIAAIIDRLDAQAFVQAMGAVAVGIAEHARQAIGRDADRNQERGIGGARCHQWHDGCAGPDLGGDIL